jgi:EmrB/QacA subfamily drug resistance transporter
MALTPRARWLAFAALCSIQLMIVIDVSIVTVALRSMQEDLDIPQARIAWVTNAYTIGFGALLLLSGRLGDLIGRKRMFVAGVGVFTAASLLSALAQSKEWLIAARFVQGIGAAMAFAVVMGIIFTLFQDQRELGKAMGALGFAQAAGASVGILAGGFLTEGISWHWVFLINIPIGLVAAFLAQRLVPADQGLGLREGADVLGAVLVTGGLLIGVYTIATVPDYGWSSANTIGFGLTSLVLLAGFVVRQATAARPLMPLGIFKSRNLTGGNVIHLLMVSATISFNILIALYLQEVAGYSPATTSFAFLPLALTSGVVAIGLSARLVMKFGPRLATIAGLIGILLGLLLALRVPEDPAYAVDILPLAVLLGAGVGLAMPAVMMLSMSVRSPSEAGLASGVAGTAGTIGDSVGLAALVAVAAAHTSTLLADGESPVSALHSGFTLSFGISAAIVAVAVIVAVVVLRPLPPMPSGPPPEEKARGEEQARAEGVVI